MKIYSLLGKKQIADKKIKNTYGQKGKIKTSALRHSKTLCVLGNNSISQAAMKLKLALRRKNHKRKRVYFVSQEK